jgi:hypothetical protein
MIRVGTSNGVAFQLAHNGIIAVEAGDLVRVRAGIDVFLRTAGRRRAGDIRASAVWYQCSVGGVQNRWLSASEAINAAALVFDDY